MFGAGFGKEHLPTIAAGEIIEIIALGVKDGVERFGAGIGNRPGRKSFSGIAIERRINMYLFANRLQVYKTITDRSASW